VKVFHRHSLNAAEPAARERNDPQDPVEQTKRLEQGEQHRRQLPMVHGRRRKSIVARRRDDQVRSKVHSKVSLHKIRHRVRMNGFGSGRRPPGHLWAQLSITNLVEVRLPDHISKSCLRVVQRKRMKRASNEKECRVLMLSRRRRRSSINSVSNSNNNAVANLPQPITARDMASRKAETRDNQKERHRHGRNNFSVTNTSGSGM